METALNDPKKVAAFVGALIGTLLGVPFLIEAIGPALWDLVRMQYPEFAGLVFWLVKAGVYVLAFSLLQSGIYLAITSAVTAAALRFAL